MRTINETAAESSVVIRKSTQEDREMIKHLMQLCFGSYKELEPYANLDGRYYLYLKDGILVAMTGLTSDSEYGHLEVDWTCTHPSYQNGGYMQELFTKMMDGVDEDVYCSCWRLPNKDKVNLHAIMSSFGFKEVVRSRVHWKVPHNCFRDYEGGCVCYTGAGCECYEDLYLREGSKRQTSFDGNEVCCRD